MEVKKDIMLIANYWHFEEEKASSRYRSFADILCQKYCLEVVTSTFCHLQKEQRTEREALVKGLPYKVQFCYEKGYKKNISFKRICSYRQFGRNVYKYLQNRVKPNLIIVSVPSLTVAALVTKYANKNHIPVIVDIQDLWLEAFKMAFSLPVISDILFYPMKKSAERIYARADKIMAVSKTYVDKGLRYNNKDKEGLSIYIGSDSALINQKTKGMSVEKTEGEFWIAYVGALGHSYDIEGVIKSLKLLKDEGVENIRFIVMGEGVLKEHFQEIAICSEVNVEFTGLLEYGKMMNLLRACDIAVNPIVGKSVASIINKVSDYAVAGKPVINTQNSAEYRDLLEEYNAGINVPNGDIEKFADAIKLLYVDSKLRETMSCNAERLYNEKFDRRKTYIKLIDVIEELIES